MIEIIFAAMMVCFVLLTLFMKNEYYKNFFLLMFLLSIVIGMGVIRGSKTISECLELANSTCVKYEEYYQIPGSDALIYGFGLVLVVFLTITLVTIIVRAFR